MVSTWASLPALQKVFEVVCLSPYFSWLGERSEDQKDVLRYVQEAHAFQGNSVQGRESVVVRAR